MNIRKQAACAVILLAMSGLAYSTTASQRGQCDSLREQTLTAMQAEDDEAAVKLAKRSLTACSKVEDAEGIADIHDTIASRHLKMRQWKEALKVADTCIDVHYSAIGCRTSRVRALEGLSRIPEARKEAQLAIRVAQSNLQVLAANSEPQRLSWLAKRHINEMAIESMNRVLESRSR